MESTDKSAARLDELAQSAPIESRSLAARDGDRYLLCGTIGATFDIWQRRLAAVSAADALFAQRIGLAAVERVMDELESDLKSRLEPGEELLPRRSPGYGDLPLSLSREIVAILDATRRIGVAVTDSNLLVPSKSVTAICEIRRREMK